MYGRSAFAIVGDERVYSRCYSLRSDVLTNGYCFAIWMRTPRLRRFLHLNFKKSNFEQPSWGTPRNRSALKSRFDKFAVVSGKIELHIEMYIASKPF